MREYVTDAVVLGMRPVRENDRTVALFTKDLGKIEVKVVAARKLVSKFSPHLDPLNLVHVRLVKKNNFTLTDVLTKNRFSRLRGRAAVLGRSLELISLLNNLLPLSVPEPRVWHSLIHAFEGKGVKVKLFLQLLGYDPLHASCANCHAQRVEAFSRFEQSFFCGKCARTFPSSELILLD